MILQLAEIFFNVISPVFALVGIGYLVSGWLELEPRTLSRAAYYLFIPGFIFNTLVSAETQASLLLRMTAYAVIVHLIVAIIAYAIARALGKTPKMVGAYILIGIFGNVGNFGLPLIEFRLGEEALLPAAIYFLAILTVAFVVGVAAANWQSGGRMGAALAVFKTPALIALVPALVLNSAEITPPILITRITGLLGNAMIPVMLVTLGVQLAQIGKVKFTRDVWVVTGIRLLIAPLLAIMLVGFFDLSGINRGAGILQTGMPAAVLCSIIALEYDLEPEFVTTTVLFSTIASIFTLTFLLAFV